jgi:hypothetical protein
VIVPVVPAAGALALTGVIENVHACGTPACDTLKLCPATVAVPVRDVVAVFAATLKSTVPGPVRFAPFVNVRKALPLVALHVHPACVVTLIVPDAAVAVTVVLAGLIE